MKKIAIFLMVFGFAGCKDDGPTTTETVVNQLTSGASRSWKIESAAISNGTVGLLSVNNLANVKDDEFVFTADPGSGASAVKLHWRIRNQVRTSASTVKGALLDYYKTGLDVTLTIQGDGSITSNDPDFTIQREADGNLHARYMKDGTQFYIELTPAAGAAFIPSTLDFDFLTDVESSEIGLEQAAGFTGSMASNCLYLSYKAITLGSPDQKERVVRYDIDNGTFTTRDFLHADFVTKELHIINDELKVVGAKFVNTYPLDLSADPVSVPHNLTMTRYGSTVVDDNVFLFGGDLLFPVGSPGIAGPNADKIYRHDQLTGQLVEVGVLPEPRYWAHGEIVDGKLYVFGGRQAFVPSPDPGEDDIFVHDMATGDNQTLKLPSPMHRTFAARYGHLIYVAGYLQFPNADPALATIETTFGVFDTHTGTFTVIPNTLGLSGRKTVFGLTIVGDKLYALIGTWGVTTFSIYRVSLAAS